MNSDLEELMELPVGQDHLSLIQIDQDEFAEPIEILVKLAQEGEIDPWNIDIVDVTDKFLKHVEEMERLDLRISGRTLHYAAILLRMKSNAMMDEQVEQIDDSWVDDFDHFQIEDYPIPQPPVRRYSQRPVTLDELIRELEKAEVVERRRVARKNVKDILVKERPTTEQVLGIAHEEDIEGRIKNLRILLDDALGDRIYITLSELVDGDRSNRLMTYISLLFLANMKEIWLEQEELFGELYIRYPQKAEV